MRGAGRRANERAGSASGRARRRRLGWRLLPAPVLVACASATNWPQYQRDAQRTGYSPDLIEPPYKLVWFRNFTPADRLHPAVQPVVAEGRLFIGTKNGLFYALDPATGAERWRRRMGAGVQHTAGVENGRVFFGCLDGCVYALNTGDGEPAWTFASPGRYLKIGFSCAVCLADGKVFIPRRDGIVYALDRQTGAVAWARPVGAMIRAGVSCHDGRVYVCAEDMRMRALSMEDGRTLWETEQVYGQGFGDFCPVVAEGKVLAQIMRSVPGQGGPSGQEAGVRVPSGMKEHRYPQTLNGKTVTMWGDGGGHSLVRANTPEMIEMRARWAQEMAGGQIPRELETYNLLWQDDILEYYRLNPHMITLQVRDEKTGESQIVAHWRVPMMGGPCAAPVRWKDGTIVTGISLFNAGFCRVDLTTGRVVDLLLNVPTAAEIESEARAEHFNVGWGNGDETVNLSIGGDVIYAMHIFDMITAVNSMPSGAFSHGAFDMRTRRWYGPRTGHLNLGTYAPEHGWSDRPILHGDPYVHIADTHRSGGGSPMAVSAPYLYHVTLEGTLIARTARGEPAK